MSETQIRERIAKLEKMTTARGATLGKAANAASIIKRLCAQINEQREPDFIDWAIQQTAEFHFEYAPKSRGNR
jgi:hypothetical protein